MLQKLLVVAAAVGLLHMQGGNFECNFLAYLCSLSQLKLFPRNFVAEGTGIPTTYYLLTICFTLAMLLPSLFMFFTTCLLTGNCQCYTDTVCAGDTIDVTEAGLPIADQADCCVGTNAGLSYNDSSCNLCIGMSVRCLQQLHWLTALFSSWVCSSCIWCGRGSTVGHYVSTQCEGSDTVWWCSCCHWSHHRHSRWHCR